MSDLRRRVGNAFCQTASPSPGPRDRATDSGDENLQLISKTKLRTLTTRKRIKRRSGLYFALGSIVGILIALFFASKQEVISLEGLIDFNLESLLESIPAGLVKDAKDLTKAERDAVSYDSFSVGLHLQSQGVNAHHPVIMIPGVISTGLESWGTQVKSRQYFRKRLWGSWTMMRALVLDQASWKQHIMLDKDTGLDPPGIKLRAAQGFDATDFFITGYWIWNKILENLATIGYDPGNAFTAAYDWRLSYANLEVRDQYFSRLKAYIETAHKTSGRKTALISHSMGSQVLFYFFKWVEHPKYGAGGPSWVNTHIDSWINISGCMLGAAKGVPAVLSGEMKDTAQMNAFAVRGLERFLSKEERAVLFRAMPGISSMLPKGGTAVWGNLTYAPDDIAPNTNHAPSFGQFLSFRPPANTSLPSSVNLTVEAALDYLLATAEPWYAEQVKEAYSHGVAHTKAEVEANENDPRKWVNPLESRLPLAPDLKIYCFYGVGKPTERAFFYKPSSNKADNLTIEIDTTYSSAPDAASSLLDTCPANSSSSCSNATGSENATCPNPAGPPIGVDHGILFSEGDGTVSLLSTGFMCARGWRSIPRYNPSGAKVVIYEMPHEPDRFSPRGGPKTGDHVDILGRSSLNDLILRIVGGRGDGVEESVGSRIWEISRRVGIMDEG